MGGVEDDSLRWSLLLLCETCSGVPNVCASSASLELSHGPGAYPKNDWGSAESLDIFTKFVLRMLWKGGRMNFVNEREEANW